MPEDDVHFNAAASVLMELVRSRNVKLLLNDTRTSVISQRLYNVWSRFKELV